jgi:hypothetical protein|tara:strand:- start:607 stop:1569 length:963 start_codon:yes stop_codon:yes gene_type:complete
MAKDTKKRKFTKDFLGGKNRLKDISGDKKRSFADTFLGDLLGFDKKIGIDKGNPGLLASLKGKRRELGTAKIAKLATKTEIKAAENKIDTAIRKIAKFNADGTVEGPGQQARPGRLTAGQRAAQNLVYKKSGGKLGGNPKVKRKMASFKADGTVAGAAQKARPGARADTPKTKSSEVGTRKKTVTELRMKATDLTNYSKQLSKLLADPKQQRRWAKLSNEDKEKIKKSVIRSGRSIFKVLDTVSPRAINTSEIKITKPKPTDKNPNALKGTNFLKFLQDASQKSQSAYANLSAGEKRAVKSLVREEGLSLPQAVSRIKNG